MTVKRIFLHSALSSLFFFVACGTVVAKTPEKLPPRILSGYLGAVINSVDVKFFVSQFLEPMHRAGFNTCDLKLQASRGGVNLSNPKQYQNVKDLGQAISDRGMLFFVYVYPEPHNGKRNPKKHAHLPAFVRADGEVVEDRFSLIHWETWQTIFNNAFEFAKHSRELGIHAVRLDLETIVNTGISYDDSAWQRFCKDQKLDNAIPRSRRAAYLKKRGMLSQYKKWFVKQLEGIVQRFEREMHSLNPDLLLGMMPAGRNWFYGAFAKHLATERAPAVFDHWCMYNGTGFGNHVLAAQKYFKKANPNNLFIPWFRINSYRPEDIKVHAYHAAFATDGYSNWVISMLSERAQHGSHLYRLPKPYTPAQYYDAYRWANKAVLSDLAAGKSKPDSAPLKPVKSLAASLKDLDKINVPSLVPAGKGSGKPQWMVLRGQQVVYVNAKAGEDIRIGVRHMAGNRRPLSVQYALIDADHNILRNECVAAGDKEEFHVTAPRAGTYALVISGGLSGQAWYGVLVHNRHMALLAKPKTYFFYCNPFTVWATRKNQVGPARIRVQTGGNELFDARFNKGANVVTRNITFDLPPEKEPVPLTLMEPAKNTKTAGTYTQNLFVSIEGSAAQPYLSDGPERRLVSPK